ncbi:uncharacterized protein LOC107819215 [Nicotiana tabacum]|uniref:Uncharacterized protein LOC107819215 n=2 Tax=Nicotiana TaxID=4085 RepID=A0A1S4CHV3_TOBAC|nr:PREDICTED: uncharacterized protein LOC104220978 [Nicotiana sylvestris]XP_016500787.1 PREDICTED: uncharacterized protein LOC107819215 [Nicotiana tabacum]
MSGRGEESDSDAPEELTTLQGIEKDEEIRKVERENKARVVREGKERRRQWAQKLTPRHTRNDESIEDIKEPENAQESKDNGGMLPDEIVKILVAREKKVFSSDSEEEHEKKPTSKKKRSKSSGSGPVILKDLPPPPCLENSLEFLKKRKMQVSRSSAVLNNSSQALRLLSTSGLLRSK